MTTPVPPSPDEAKKSKRKKNIPTLTGGLLGGASGGGLASTLGAAGLAIAGTAVAIPAVVVIGIGVAGGAALGGLGGWAFKKAVDSRSRRASSTAEEAVDE